MASIYDLSATAASNTTIDGTDVSGATGKIKDGDNVMRSLGAFSAQFIKDTGAVNTVAGTGDAITVTLSSSITAYATGQIFRFIAGAANTTAVTLDVNGIGIKAIRKISGGTDVALVSGDILAGDTYTLIYRATANAAAGGWVMIGASTYLPLGGGTLTGQLINTGSSVGYTPLSMISTEAAAAAGPIVDLYRNSASPAASDIIGEVDFNGQNSTPAKKTYASVRTRIDTATATSEAATLVLAAQKAGTVTDYVYAGSNAAGTATANAVGLPLGRLSFPATQNASSDANTLDDYEEGTWTPGITFNGSAAGVVASFAVGRYIKVGQNVFLTARLVLTNNGSGVGGAVITGLPFTAVNDTISHGGGVNFSNWVGCSAVVGNPTGYVYGNTTTITLSMSGAAGSAFMTDTNITNTGDLLFYGSYQASA